MSTKKKAAAVKALKPFAVELTAAGKIEVGALEKKFPDLTRVNIVGAASLPNRQGLRAQS